MGGIVNSLFSWVSPALDTRPDPGTGLSEKDIHLIRSSWALVADKKVVKHNAIEFFIQLFGMFPYMQDYFFHFKGLTLEEARKHPKMKGHSLTAMYSIQSYVDNLDDPDTLVDLVEKLATNHVKRNIRDNEFKGVEKMFITFLRSRLGEQCTPDIEDAWSKLLVAQTAIVKKVQDELDLTKIDAENKQCSV